MQNNIKMEEYILRAMTQGFVPTMTIYTACELNIFEVLYKVEKSLTEIAEELKIEEGILFRFLRILVAYDLVLDAGGIYKDTKIGEKLSEKSTGNLKGYVLYSGRECMRAWGKMSEAMLKNTYPYQLLEGDSFFKIQEEDERKFYSFNAMMSKTSSDIDFKKYFSSKIDSEKRGQILDVGGGAGCVLFKFLKHYKFMNGEILDLEHVKEVAEEGISRNHLRDRCNFRTGDFFEEYSGEADIVILSKILHDWEDDKAQVIINNVKKVMNPNATLIVIEKKLPCNIEREAINDYIQDLNIWALCGGKERTEEEFRDLFEKCQLEIISIVELNTGDYLFEIKEQEERGAI